MSDTELMNAGMRVLSEKLNIVDAGRFVALISRNKTDYTKWREIFFEDISLEELAWPLKGAEA